MRLPRKSDPRVRSFLLGLVVALGLFPAGLQGAAPQAGRLQARHHEGQTFLTWEEVDPHIRETSISMAALRQAAEQAARGPKVAYRIYRSARPIASVEGLDRLADVPPLSGWNRDYYGGEMREDQEAYRYVLEEGKPAVAPGIGVYVHNPRQAGEAYYAVTRIVDGKENTALEAAYVLQQPVRETVGRGVPVLQRIRKPKEFQYIAGPTLYDFVRWESPPNCSVEGRPFDYVVAAPPNPARPAPVGIHLHCWGGSLNGGYGWWYNAEKGDLLLASNQVPYDWWTGYHESYWSGPREKQAWQQGVVRPYSQQRMLSFLDWMTTRWEIDLARTHVAGNSMGGSGAPMLAIRYPEQIAWAVAWVGVHIPAQSPTFRGSYANVYGEPEWGVKFEDGTPVWDYFNDAWYLRRYPEKEIGLITFSNGKNDGGIGWAQAVEFFRALQETRRPHVFVWGQSGHGQRAAMPGSLGERVLPIDVRIDQTLPAFTRCSLDDRPGDGQPGDGDPKGQANLYLSWETGDAVDREDRWEMTVGLIDRAPRDEAAVDLTPRRCRQFQPQPQSKVAWTNRVAGEVVQSGQSTADRWGLVTLEQVRVSKARHRIEIRPAEDRALAPSASR